MYFFQYGFPPKVPYSSQVPAKKVGTLPEAGKVIPFKQGGHRAVDVAVAVALTAESVLVGVALSVELTVALAVVVEQLHPEI